MVPLSVLDLSPITEGGDAGQSLRNSLDLARHVEALGYRRYWMAEHHNLPGIASAATAVALAHVAAGTNNIRIGAGGIMLPNHAPLLIAEQFGTLAALHPGRVELGLGRAPGSDQITARAVRTSQGSPGVIKSLGAVRRRYDELMIRAAATPEATLGQRLYTARRRANLTAAEAAAALGAPADLIIAVESETPPPGDMRARIEEVIAELNA